MERDEMPADVLFVGAGPANLAGAIHLMNLIEAHNAAVEAGEKEGEELDEPMIIVLEKGSELDPEALLAWGRERLAAFKLPRSFVAVPSLPRTASGKAWGASTTSAGVSIRTNIAPMSITPWRMVR